MHASTAYTCTHIHAHPTHTCTPCRHTTHTIHMHTHACTPPPYTQPTTHTCTHTNTHTTQHIHIHEYTRTYMHTPHMHAPCTCTHTCTHIYICMHAHHTHHTHAHLPWMHICIHNPPHANTCIHTDVHLSLATHSLQPEVFAQCQSEHARPPLDLSPLLTSMPLPGLRPHSALCSPLGLFLVPYLAQVGPAVPLPALRGAARDWVSSTPGCPSPTRKICPLTPSPVLAA